MGLSQYRLAKDIGVPPRRINEVVHRKRAITVDTALRLARYFGTSARFWLTCRHSTTSTSKATFSATDSKARSFSAPDEAPRQPQRVLARLGARRHPRSGRYIAPHDATIRRAVAAVDADAVDRVIGAWLADQTRARRDDDDGHAAPAATRLTARPCAARCSATASRCTCCRR